MQNTYTKFNVAGYIGDRWHWGHALKTESGKYDFTDDTGNITAILKPIHIKIYGKILDLEVA